MSFGAVKPTRLVGYMQVAYCPKGWFFPLGAYVTPMPLNAPFRLCSVVSCWYVAFTQATGEQPDGMERREVRSTVEAGARGVPLTREPPLEP